jgi:hypothetical protein
MTLATGDLSPGFTSTFEYEAISTKKPVRKTFARDVEKSEKNVMLFRHVDGKGYFNLFVKIRRFVVV